MNIDARIRSHARKLKSGVYLQDEAETLVRRLRSLAEWDDYVERYIVDHVHDLLRSELRSQRARAYRNAGRRRFKEQCDDGDIPLIEVHYAVNGDGLTMPLGEMTGTELRYVLADRRRSAKAAQLEMLYFAELARRVGKRKVADVFTNDQLEALRKRLKRNAA